MKGFFEHKADIGIWAKGKNFEETLEELSRALFEVMFIKKGKKTKKMQIEIEDKDKEILILRFINELITRADKILFSDIKIEKKGNKIKAVVYYSDFEPDAVITEVKGATLSGIKVEDKEMQVLLDV